MTRIPIKLLYLTLYLIDTNAMIMRNEALISKMVSNFQKDIPETSRRDVAPQQQQHQPQQQPKNVLALMQNVLCKNFPTIPCDMIQEDETLKNLIERSIQQLKYKKLNMVKTTVMPGYHLTLFPTVNSEDLSNFLQVADTGYFEGQERPRIRKHKKRFSKHSPEKQTKKKKSKSKKKDNQHSSLYSNPKKIRKFYPHKVKYKNKLRENFREYSEEKLSMSVEAPEINDKKKGSYRTEADHPPVWRIDYLKHGDPGLTMFEHEPETLKEKLVRTGPNVILGQGMVEQNLRKEVLHPDVYIKTNFIRKTGMDMNSGAID